MNSKGIYYTVGSGPVQQAVHGYFHWHLAEFETRITITILIGVWTAHITKTSTATKFKQFLKFGAPQPQNNTQEPKSWFSEDQGLGFPCY